MYRITDENGNVIAQVDSPRYVRLKKESGAWVQCPANLAECVAVNGIRYSLVGKDIVEDAPVVVFVQNLDAATELYHTAKTTNINTNDIDLLGYAIEKMAIELVEKLEKQNE